MSDTLHHIQTAQIIPLFGARPKLAKEFFAIGGILPILNAKKAYPIPPEISASEATAATSGGKPMRSWNIGTFR
jgi:hypothetical protein